LVVQVRAPEAERLKQVVEELETEKAKLTENLAPLTAKVVVMKYT
jgi:hypothetical protein